MIISETKEKRAPTYRYFAKRPYTPNPPKAWAKRDEGVKKFYVYILKLDNGDYYIGQTREPQERMMEHKDGQIPSTAGRKPKLQYFEILGSRASAMSREKELENIKTKNRREIVRIICEFQAVTKDLDYS
jgi:predicted GIY-YIG superfamily endonuclease